MFCCPALLSMSYKLTWVDRGPISQQGEPWKTHHIKRMKKAGLHSRGLKMSLRFEQHLDSALVHVRMRTERITYLLWRTPWFEWYSSAAEFCCKKDKRFTKPTKPLLLPPSMFRNFTFHLYYLTFSEIFASVWLCEITSEG